MSPARAKYQRMGKRALAARDAIIGEHLDWAHAIAAQVSRALPSWFLPDDLAGPAEIALIQLAAQYDPERGVPFRAFAQRRIYGACFDSVRRREYRERSHATVMDTHHDRAPSPEQQARLGEMRRIWEYVSRLPHNHAVVIHAIYAEEMTNQETAERLLLSTSRTSQLHQEALEMMRGMCAEMRP